MTSTSLLRQASGAASRRRPRGGRGGKGGELGGRRPRSEAKPSGVQNASTERGLQSLDGPDDLGRALRDAMAATGIDSLADAEFIIDVGSESE